jgi:DNA-binding NtrC family response regulator
MAEERIAHPTVMAVFQSAEDRMLLDTILTGPTWKLRFARTFAEARTALHSFVTEVVMSEGCFSDGHCWKDLLREIQGMKSPPPLIVADRLADECLWAEVLNLGGYDLLVKPLDAKEVLHVVTMAWRSRQNECERMTVMRKSAKSAERNGVSAKHPRAAGHAR